MHPFSIPYDPLWLKGDVLAVSKQAPLFFLHGAGTASRERFSAIRKNLHAKGIGSVAFDHIGHGETGGELTGSTLADRTAQASVILAGLETNPTVFFGTSMGAYTVIKCSQTYPMQTIILGVPGVYASQAYDVPFGPEFSAILRQERSWEHSDAFDILSRFTGNLLVIAAKRDEVVSSEIPSRLFKSARNASRRELLELDCDHQLMRHLSSHPEDMEMICERTANFLQ